MSGGWEFLLQVSVKGALVLGVAFLLSLALQRASASTRHLLWTLTLAGVLFLPLLSMVLPGWQAPVLPAASGMLAAPAGAVPRDSGLPASATPGSDFPNWPGRAAAVWAAGAILVLARLVVGMVRVRGLARRARPIQDRAWIEALEELSERLGLAVRVRLLKSPKVALPMTWGLRQPVVLLPEDAEEWPPGRASVVLLHELAHVKRRDCLTQVLAQTACALHWFNPLVWLAARRFAIERERACDDRVLGLGTRASEYAGHLLEVARSLHQRQTWALASVAMARRSQFEGRLVAILDPRVRRRHSRWAVVLAAGALAGVVAPVAALRPQTPVVETGALVGTIYDATYGVVPNAQVAVIDRHSRVERTTLTGAAGEYSLAALPAGRYDWEVRARGFQVSLRRDVRVEAGRKARLNAVLRIGGLSESIEVTGQGSPGATPETPPPQRIRVGGNVQASRIARMTRPQYPEGARSRGLTGEVLLRAVLRTDGSLGELGVLSAPDPELSQAALEAVRQWRYEPTLLNGRAVEVETTIAVSFHLKP